MLLIACTFCIYNILYLHLNSWGAVCENNVATQQSQFQGSTDVW